MVEPEPLIVYFTLKGEQYEDGKQAHVVGQPGTNFGMRLDAIEVVRLSEDYGLDSLPFVVMAAGYGDDEDWAELQEVDVFTTSAMIHDMTGRPATRQDLASKLAEAWGPFEVTADDRDSLPSELLSLARFQVRSTPVAFWVVDTISTERAVSGVFSVMADAVKLADTFNADPSQAKDIGGAVVVEDDLVTAVDDLLARLDQTYDEDRGVSIIDTFPPTIMEAIENLRRAFNAAPSHWPDLKAIAKLANEAEWEERPDYGDGVSVAYHGIGGPVADALNWQCVSCRPEVGWADWTRMQKAKDGTITMFVECGHCGWDAEFDMNGVEVRDA